MIEDLYIIKLRTNMGNLRESIKEKEANIFNIENNDEQRRLQSQQKLLYDFDMEVYQKFIDKNKPINILDLGCNDGRVGLSRFKNFKINKYLGLDIINYPLNSQINNIFFEQVDLECDEIETKLIEYMQRYDIDKFDVINCLALFAHIKEPIKLLKVITKFCRKGGVFFIRNIDDGFNVCYGSKMFEKAMSFLDKTRFTGYRYSGRQIPSFLTRAGIENFALVKTGIDNIRMTEEMKLNLFYAIIDFILNSLKKEKEYNIISKVNLERLDWLQQNYELLKNDFLKETFFIHFGFMFYVAKV